MIRSIVRRSVAGGALALAAVPSLVSRVAQERVDLEVGRRIREAGRDHSRIPELAADLTDVIGPRLTGSPATRPTTDQTASRLIRLAA